MRFLSILRLSAVAPSRLVRAASRSLALGLLVLFVGSGLAAQSPPIPLPGKLLAPLPPWGKAAPAAKDLLFTEHTRILPQVASSGSENESGFFTLLTFTALTDVPAQVSLWFFDGAGRPMEMPIFQVNPDGTACLECPPEFAPGVAGMVQPGQQVGQVIRPSGGAARVGYAVLASDPPVSVAASAVFAQVIPGRPLFMTGVPSSFANHQRAFMPTADRDGFTSSVALVAANGATSIELTFRDVFLSVECSTSFAMSDGAHRAFLFRDVLPCIGGHEGAVEIRGTGFAGIGIWAHDQGAFVTQPLMEKLEP